MNLEDIKMLRELHQLQQAGIITSDDFNLKKSEILSSQKPVSSDEKIKLLQELHQLTQDGVISQEEFNTKKQELLNTASSSNPIAVAPTQEKSEQNDDARQSSFDSTSMFGSGIEKTLHELNIDGLNMKLSNEKIYVNSSTATETFALRSVNGIGIVDLVDKLNEDLKTWKTLNPTGMTKEKFEKRKENLKIIGGIGTLIYLFIIFLGSPEAILLSIFFLSIFPGLLAYGLLAKFDEKKFGPMPVLKSAVRIMFSGIRRDFEFDKKSSNAQEVAKFVALVEDTLTSYHKNN